MAYRTFLSMTIFKNSLFSRVRGVCQIKHYCFNSTTSVHHTNLDHYGNAHHYTSESDHQDYHNANSDNSDHGDSADNYQELYSDYEISTAEFEHVERVLPKKLIPEPPMHTSYPTTSGWFPPSELEEIKSPYYIERTRNHQFPLYLDTFEMRHRTILRKIGGDIWALEGELREFLQNRTGRQILTRVHEVARQIRIKGAHIQDVSDFLTAKGF